MTESDPEPSDVSGPSAAEKRSAVRERYGSIAATAEEAQVTEPDEGGCCGDSSSSDSCCGGGSTDSLTETLGYDSDEVTAVPEHSNLGLGCGNPTAIAELEPGETVLDLGSGAGFDCFLAAREVGADGQVIGVDMTPEMVERARRNAEHSPFDVVEFRLGEIEHLPVPNSTVDVVISNCVLNLSPAKARVFDEVYRVLDAGGRLTISDVVMTERGSQELDAGDLDQYASCVSGAATIPELEQFLADAGFESVSVQPKSDSDSVVREMFGDESLSQFLYSARIRGRKPASEST